MEEAIIEERLSLEGDSKSKDPGTEFKKALRAEKAGYFSEATKALVALNSGGALAILTFMGALTKSEQVLSIFKAYGRWGFISFAVGMVAALFAPLVLVDHVAAVRNQNGRANNWIQVTAAVYAISIAGLVFGLVAVTLGLFASF